MSHEIRRVEIEIRQDKTRSKREDKTRGDKRRYTPFMTSTTDAEPCHRNWISNNLLCRGSVEGARVSVDDAGESISLSCPAIVPARVGVKVRARMRVLEQDTANEPIGNKT